MAVTAADGIWGFAPQLTKTTLPGTPKWYRHKASLVDLGVIDDQRVGPLEVGGGPFPTFPYKAGYVVAGGATFMPRLEDVIGWLLYAGVGDCKSSVPIAGTNVHAEITLVGSPTDTTTAITAPPAGGASVSLTVGTPAGTTCTAGITVTGTDNLDQPLVVTFTITAKAVGSIVLPSAGTKFKTVTKIAEVTGTASDKITIKYRLGMKHSFVPKSTSPSAVKWLSCRKYIPQKDADAATDLGETYTGCKPLGFVFTLPNDSPVSCRMDVLGRTFAQEDSISGWSWVNTYEDWDSIPVGCETGGGITFSGGAISEVELPVVAAQVGWVNTPLDLRQERVFGDPSIEDITIISRQMTYDCTVKWNDPDVYRAITTGSKTGTVWQSTPLTGQMVATMVGSGVIAGGQKYSLQITSPQILWQMNGTPVLAAGQAIMMRFTGIALDAGVGDYTTIDLINEEDSYIWPTV